MTDDPRYPNPTDLPARFLDEGEYGSTPLALEDIEVGQHVAVHSRGKVREVRVSKIGRKNVTIEYVTQGGIKEAHKIAEMDNVARVRRQIASDLDTAAEYHEQADAISAGRVQAPPYADAEQYRRWADDLTDESKHAERLAKAEAEDAVPYEQRVVNATSVTGKTVPATSVFPLVEVPR
jgi:hypothetical protein